jgi:hypothetical protein
MRVFNKVVVVIFILVAVPVSTLLLVLPDVTATTLADTFSLLAVRAAAFQQTVRTGLAFLALAIDLVLFWLLYLELRPKATPGGRVMRVRGGEGELSQEAIHQRIHHHVSQLPDVVEVEPEIGVKGGRVEVTLEVVTSPHVNVPQKLDEVVQVVREAVVGGMGLRLRGKPVISIRHVSYKEASPPASKAVMPTPPSPPATENMSGDTAHRRRQRPWPKLRRQDKD